MNNFVLNIILTFIWMLLTASINLFNFFLGFMISYLVLYIFNLSEQKSEYFAKMPILIKFTLSFIWELIVANLQVANDVLTPRNRMVAGIIAVPLEDLSDMEITWFANLITLTPGTLSLMVSDDKKVLYVHGMYIKDPETFKKELKEKFEKDIMRIGR